MKRIIINTALVLAAAILIIIVIFAIIGLKNETKKNNDKEYAKAIAMACQSALANEDAYGAAMEIIDSPAGQLVFYLDASGLTGAPKAFEKTFCIELERYNTLHVPEYISGGAEVFIIKMRDNSVTVWYGKKDGTTISEVYDYHR